MGTSLRPDEERLWGGPLRHPTLVVGLEVPRAIVAERIEGRARRMWERGVEAEVREAFAGPVSQTARTIHGLADIAELPRERAHEALVARTRRYAAYQRKWMRRTPGVRLADGDRPADEIAAEIEALLKGGRPR